MQRDHSTVGPAMGGKPSHMLSLALAQEPGEETEEIREEMKEMGGGEMEEEVGEIQKEMKEMRSKLRGDGEEKWGRRWECTR